MGKIGNITSTTTRQKKNFLFLKSRKNVQTGFIRETCKGTVTKTKPPKYCIDKGKKKAYVKIDGKKSYLPGKSNSPESKEAYARFEIEWWENSRCPVAERIPPTLVGNGIKTDTTVKEVALAFLQYAESAKNPLNFDKYRLAIIRSRTAGLNW